MFRLKLSSGRLWENSWPSLSQLLRIMLPHASEAINNQQKLWT